MPSISKCKIVEYVDHYNYDNIQYGFPLVRYSCYGNTSEGQNGVDGGNIEGIKRPDPVERTNTSFSVNKFKYHVRDNLAKNIREFVFRKLLEYLDNHKFIQTFYDVFGFADELCDIWNQYYRLRNQLSFIPFVQSILNRQLEYANNYTESNANKTALIFLYTTALSKLFAILNHGNRVSTIDLFKHLSSVQENIDHLREAIKDTTIHEYQYQYKASLTKKIKLVNDFIRIKIKSKIEHISNGTEDQIPAIVDSVINQPRDFSHECDELSDKRKHLENVLRLHMMLSVANVIHPLLELFVSISDVLVEIIGGVTSISNAFYTDPLTSEEKEKIVWLIESVNLIIRVLRGKYSKKHEILLKQLDDIEMELVNSFGNWSRPIKFEVKRLKFIIKVHLNDEAIPNPN